MRLTTLYFIGGLGSLTLLLTVAGGVTMQIRKSNPQGKTGLIDVVGGALSALLWSLFALGATNVTEVVDGTGDVIHHSSPGLLYTGVAMVGLSILIAIFGTAFLVDVTDVSA